MEKIFFSSYSAYSTIVTVKYLFLFPFIIKKVTNFTKVSRKLYLAFLTLLLRSLNMFTIHALDIYNRMSIHLMILFRIHFILIFDFIMTDSACKELFAFWTLFLTSPTIMFAPILRILLIYEILFL
jgi:hypothetical protein